MAEKKKHAKGLYKFLAVLGIFVAYLAIAVFHYGVANGVLVALLSWSFFVFCTPIADAGFLLDFPIRLATKFRMLYTEIFVWVFAFTLNVFAHIFYPSIYGVTSLLKLMQKIITTPWPLGLIIVLSAIGTFVSLVIGDDTFDIAIALNKAARFKRERLQLIVSISTYVITILLYVLLLTLTHTSIKLF